MGNVAYNIDCVEFMRSIPDKHFDLTIADPPYGISITNRHKVGRSAKVVGGGHRPFGGSSRGLGKSGSSPKFYPVFDDCSPPDADTFRELRRVSKNLVIWGWNFFADKFPHPASCVIVWDKQRRGLDQADCELAWTDFPGQPRIFEFKWNGMLQGDMKHKEQRIHATQKPVALYKWILQRFAQPGMTVFDPYLGSGSSRIAAYDLGFDFTGCELSKTYFDLQEKRFAEHTAQLSLFVDG